MVDALLDTAIVVDLLRAYTPAAQWINSQNQTFGVTKFVWMEIVRGCEDKPSLRRATQLLERFELIQIQVEDIDWALEKLVLFNLSHNIDYLDCLIAAPAQRLQTPLYTRNMKHFAPLLGELAQQPY